MQKCVILESSQSCYTDLSVYPYILSPHHAKLNRKISQMLLTIAIYADDKSSGRMYYRNRSIPDPMIYAGVLSLRLSAGIIIRYISSLDIALHSRLISSRSVSADSLSDIIHGCFIALTLLRILLSVSRLIAHYISFIISSREIKLIE